MKKRALLIAEKPDLMRKIKAVYDKYGHEDHITFKHFVGHIVRLKEPGEYKQDWKEWNIEQLPMIPEKFEYVPDKSKLDVYKDIKKEIETGEYDYLINGCDSGREGQAIYWNCIQGLNKNIPTKRLWLNDLTEKKIKEGLDNLIDETEPWLENMTKASQLRGYFDWGVGMNFTRCVSLVGGQKVNLGRVMTPTLKMVVDRELEIKNFVPKDFWEVECNFGKYKGLYVYENSDGEETTQIWDKDKGSSIVNSLDSVGLIESIVDEKVVKNPPELYSLANLQNEANKVYGYTMSETLEIAQGLYEKQYISYPRTDSAHVTSAVSKEFEGLLNVVKNIPELALDVQKVLNTTGRVEEVSKKKKYVDDSKVSDHYAIIVTDVVPNLENLSEKEKNVYILVAKRFLSIFMNPMTSSKTTIITRVGDKKFKTVGKMLIDLGYRALYNYKFESDVISGIKEGDRLNIVESNLISKKTTAPARLVDATLNNLMENAGRLLKDEELKEVIKTAKGIGTPATRAQIVEKLVQLKMIERRKKSFYATDYGINIIEQLSEFDITSVELTAKWEQKLSKIEACEYNADVFYKEMVEYIERTTKEIKEKDISFTSSKKVLGDCPNCTGQVIEGKKYYVCSNYKKEGIECNFAVGKVMWGSKISSSEVIKLLKGKETKEFNFKIEKDGVTKQWKSALFYDKTNKKLAFPVKERASVCSCPVCGGDVIEGKDYYLCEKYKNGCELILPKKYLKASLSKSDIVNLLSGKETKEKTLEINKNGEVRKWKGKLRFDVKGNKFVFPKSEKKIIAECPKCSKKIIEGKGYYLCEGYKDTCEVIIPKIYSNGIITAKDVADMMSGKETRDIQFKWKSGKTGTAKLKYTNKLEFVFNNYKK